MIQALLFSLLGIASGIFIVLSLIEKPVWRLMRDSRSPLVSDAEARAVHAILKRLIHLLPPIMITNLGVVSLLLLAQAAVWPDSTSALIVAAVFLVQLGLIALRLRRDIRGVAQVPTHGNIRPVRDGLGALVVVHHRGLLMSVSTLIAQGVLIR